MTDIERDNYMRRAEDLRRSLPKGAGGNPVSIWEISDDELDKYIELEDWMPLEFKERLLEYWALRDEAIEYQVCMCMAFE